MRFLCISDIHGHVSKLEKVLEAGRLRNFDQVICCGDLLFPGPAPLATWKLLLEVKAVCVQGVSDAALARVDPDSLVAENDAQRARIERLAEFHDELGELIIARLARLKDRARLPLESGHEMLVVHGSPSDPMEAMSDGMSDAELSALLGDEGADLIVCGANHVPFERQLFDTRIVNVGSVGEHPDPRFASAGLIESTPLGISVNLFDVEL